MWRFNGTYFHLFLLKKMIIFDKKGSIVKNKRFYFAKTEKSGVRFFI